MKYMAFVVVSTLLAQPLPASAQGVSGEDPLLGTWHLNVSKSTYNPGPAPKSQTRIYKKHRFGIEGTVKTVEADGRTMTVQSVFDYDKQEHPVTGAEDIDTIVMTRINTHTSVATFSHAGMEIGTFERVVSRDGKQMTVTLKRSTPQTSNVEIYQKEEQ